MSIVVKNEAEVRRRIELAGDAIKLILQAATVAGAEILEQFADNKAPGDHNTYEVVSAKPHEVQVHIGPDAEHWYYRFFETGVQPHVVKAIDAKALEIVPGSVYRSQATPGGFAARPFLRPAIRTGRGKTEDVVGDKFKGALPV